MPAISSSTVLSAPPDLVEPTEVEPDAPSRAGRARKAARFAVPLTVLTVVTWVGTLAAPALTGSHPLLLIALAPRLPFLALASGSVPLWAYLLVGGLRMAAANPVNYLLGKAYGPGAFDWASRKAPKLGGPLRGVEAFVKRFGLLGIALRPNQSALVLAGAERLRPWKVAVAAGVGHVGWLLLARSGSSPTRAAVHAVAPFVVSVFSTPYGWAALAAALTGVVVVRRRRSTPVEAAVAVAGND